MTHQLTQVIISLQGQSVQISGIVRDIHEDAPTDLFVDAVSEPQRLYIGSIDMNQSEIVEQWQKTEKNKQE